MKILYCDCFSGISGDMFLAAMLDAGLPEEVLTEELSKLGLQEFKGVKTSKVLRGTLQASLLEFDLDEDIHEHEQNHIHNHKFHRHLSDILGLIEASTLPQSVKQNASAIFQKLGEAEAKVHGTSIEQVHFHEVGALDSILDIVGAAVAIEYFKIEEIFASALPLGSGTIKTEHGLLPIPAPATLELLTTAKARVVPSQSTKELVTPTGAAILATLATFKQPDMQLSNIGLGAGNHELPWANVLRLIIGERTAPEFTHVEIETNIDDMNPQFYASVMQHLFAQGAKDVYFTPIQMKKNRPGVKISVMAAKKDEAALSQVLLRETSTMGVRVKELQRHEADREMCKVSTRYGEVSVKLKRLEGKVIQANPEYEECLMLSEKLQLPVSEVYRAALCAASGLITY